MRLAPPHPGQRITGDPAGSPPQLAILAERRPLHCPSGCVTVPARPPVPAASTRPQRAALRQCLERLRTAWCREGRATVETHYRRLLQLTTHTCHYTLYTPTPTPSTRTGESAHPPAHPPTFIARTRVSPQNQQPDRHPGPSPQTSTAPGPYPTGLLLSPRRTRPSECGRRSPSGLSTRDRPNRSAYVTGPRFRIACFVPGALRAHVFKTGPFCRLAGGHYLQPWSASFAGSGSADLSS